VDFRVGSQDGFAAGRDGEVADSGHAGGRVGAVAAYPAAPDRTADPAAPHPAAPKQAAPKQAAAPAASAAANAHVTIPNGFPPHTRRRRIVFTFLTALAGAAGLTIWRGPPTALLFVGCTVFTLMLLPAVGRWASRHGAVALPGGRGIHSLPTPLIGGAALYVPVALTLIGLGLAGHGHAWGLLLGGTIVFLAGLCDDLWGISPRFKILAQVLAGCALLLTGFHLPALGLPGVGVATLGSGLLSMGLLLFWIVLATNALNLSDGLDGLATSLAILGMGVFAAVGVGGLLPVALAGACLGFLYFNLPNARIFLGDAGSLLLGFLLAALALQIPVQANVPLALAVFSYPLGDVTLAVIRRKIRGKPLFAPDRSHLHHKALRYLGSPLRALVAALAFATLHAALLVIWPSGLTLAICAALWIVLTLTLIRLGCYQPVQILAARRPMRRLHLVRDYVQASLALAETPADVGLALQHLVEAAEVETIGLEGLLVQTRRPLCTRHDLTCTCRDVTVSLPQRKPHAHARFCTWSGPSTMHGEAMDQERETIMAGLLRQAVARLDHLDPSPDQGPPTAPVRDDSPCMTPTSQPPLLQAPLRYGPLPQEQPLQGPQLQGPQLQGPQLQGPQLQGQW